MHFRYIYEYEGNEEWILKHPLFVNIRTQLNSNLFTFPVILHE